MARNRIAEAEHMMFRQQMTIGREHKTRNVLNYLRDHEEGITPMIAFKRFNVTRLASIIFELRHHYGLTIHTHRECENGISYARYTLEDVQDVL